MNEWQKEEQRGLAENTKIANQLAKCLKGKPAEIYHYAFDILFDVADSHHGMGIGVNTRDNKGKYKVFLLWPTIDHREYRPDDTHCIQVSKDRGIGALTKEITRRLLPGYLAAWEAQVARAKAELDERNARENLVREFCKLGSDKYGPSPMELHSGNVRTGHHGLQEFRVSEDGKRIKLETYYLPADVARKVVGLLKSLIGRDG